MEQPTEDTHFSLSQPPAKVAPTRSSWTTSAAPTRSNRGNGQTTPAMVLVSAPSPRSPLVDAPGHTTALSQAHTTCFKCQGKGHRMSQCPSLNLLSEVKELGHGSHEDDVPLGDDVYIAGEALADKSGDTPELIDHTSIRPAALAAVEAPAPASTLTSTPMRDMISDVVPRSLVDVIPPPQLLDVTSREVILVPRPSTLTSTPPLDSLLRTSIFYPHEKINSSVCQVIMDIGGCDLAALESVLLPPGLSIVSHDLPYDVSLIGTTPLMRLHGLPKSIISDRNMRFTSHFWRTLRSLLETELTFFSSYHPQSDVQTDVANQVVQKHLRSLVCESLTTWDVTLLCTEFAHHSSTDHTAGVSPVETTHGLAPYKPLDIAPLDPHVRVSEDRVAFAQHVSQLHQDIHDGVLSQYALYKQAADLHYRSRVFQVGDQVMVRLRPERYAPGTTRSTGPSRVLSRIGGIAYVVDVPPLWGISSTFHVMDLTSHPAPPLSSDVKPSPTGPFLEREFAQKSTFPALPPDRHERVEEIFREVIDFSRDGVSWRFLVHWPGRPPEDDVWISEANLQRLRSDLWEPLPSFFVNSSESSSFDPRRIDGERDPSPPSRETSTTRVQHILQLFYFRTSFLKFRTLLCLAGPIICSFYLFFYFPS